MADILDSSGNIKSGLRADIMRQAMETKALLTQNGSLYVGTGEALTVDDGVNSYKLYRTAELLPPSEPKVLVGSSSGLAWRSITGDLITDRTIPLSKLTSNLVNPDTKSDVNGIMSIGLGQNNTTNQILIDTFTINEEKLVDMVLSYNQIPVFYCDENGVLTIQDPRA